MTGADAVVSTFEREPAASSVDARRRNLARLLRPKSVAVVGGRSSEPVLAMIRRSNFPGPVHMVNPTRSEIGGVKCVPTVNDLPSAPDATFLNVSRDVLPDVVSDLSTMDAGGGVAYAAGFKELGASGERYESALGGAVGNFALLGPNANGLINSLDGVALWPTESHEPRRLDKGIAIISQSGTIAYNYVNSQRSVHPGYIVCLGNQSFVDVADVMDAVLEDDRVGAIGLFLEGVPDVPAFAAAAERAARLRVPIVAMKAGRTDTGARMAQTHTGAMVTNDAFFGALFDRLGIHRAETLSALDETLKMVSVGGCRPGRRVASLTMCGAYRTIFADAADTAGLEMPRLDEAASASLRAQLPEFATVSNPLDYNAPYTGMDVLSLENGPALKTCFETFLGVPHDISIMLENMDRQTSPEEIAASPTFQAWLAADSAAGRRKVIISGSPERFAAGYREAALEAGVVPLQGIEDGTAAIAASIAIADRWEEMGSEIVALERLPELDEAGDLLDEVRSKAALAGFGLAVPPSRSCSVADAPGTAAALGFPVVLKAVSSTVAHKAAVGGVALGLRDAASVEAAALRISDGFAARGLPLDGLLLERMIEPIDAELIAGIVRDSGFGLALMLGAGGSRAEAIGDADLLLLPSGDGDLQRFCNHVSDRLGLPEGCRPSLLGAVRAISAYAWDNRDRLVELDVNPLVVTGNDVIAVDAVIRLAPGTGG
jgi:acyl-CoA synthetase (NDP forming)